MARRVVAAILLCVFASGIADARPARWCGWWMRQQLGVADTKYDVAANWARYGSRADGPAVGTIVVWRHHVGRITGGEPGHWIVESGNVRNRVYEGEMSLRGAIAFRWPS